MGTLIRSSSVRRSTPASQQLWDYPKVRTPFRVADRYYFSANDGLQNQDVLYTRKTLGDGEVEVVIDPNTWSEDGTVALGGTSFSPDGRYLAYAVADAGSDWKTWRIRDLSTGIDLPDRIKWSKFAEPGLDARWQRLLLWSLRRTRRGRRLRRQERVHEALPPRPGNAPVTGHPRP